MPRGARRAPEVALGQRGAEHGVEAAEKKPDRHAHFGASFIRGQNRANPVLLFLHGGPGLPEKLFSHVNAELARDFTVVRWDQRGAGKSYRPDRG